MINGKLILLFQQNYVMVYISIIILKLQYEIEHSVNP